ncbi:MAG: tetratricopeptide repeat protein [Flavobacteriales bacterium]
MDYGNYLFLCGEKEKSIEVLQSILKRSDLKYKDEFIASACKSLSRISEIEGKYLDCVYYADTAITISRNIGNKKIEADATLNRGNGLINLNRNEEAIACYYRADGIYKELEDSSGMSMALGNIGNYYCRINQFEKALQIFDSEFEIIPSRVQLNALITNIGNRAYVRISLGQSGDEVEQLLKDCRSMARNGNYTSLLSWALSLSGYYYVNLKEDFQKAKEYYDEGLKLAKTSGNAIEQFRIISSLASVHLNLKNYDSCNYYLPLAYNKIVELNDSTELLKLLKLMATSYAEMNDFERAFTYYAKWDSLNAIFLSRERIELLSKMETEFANQKLRAETLEKDLEISNKKGVIYLMFIITIILSALFIFYRKRTRRKHKEQILLIEESIKRIKKDRNEEVIFSIDRLKKCFGVAHNLNIQDFELLLLLINSRGQLTNHVMSEELKWSHDTLRYHKRKIVQAIGKPGATNEEIISEIIGRLEKYDTQKADY